MIAPDANIDTGVVFGAPLADQDIPGNHGLITKFLYPETFGF
jgi:hypothetical protein